MRFPKAVVVSLTALFGALLFLSVVFAVFLWLTSRPGGLWIGDTNIESSGLQRR